MQYLWPVVPLCEKQLRDINPDDVLNNGLYRKCDIYKGGGGYDKFEEIYHRRFNTSVPCRHQFVVQVAGCPLRCPYCYVTEEGVRGEADFLSTTQLTRDFHTSGCDVFHLMGGAPALYLDQWPELVAWLRGSIFHSDLLCLEQSYSSLTLAALTGHDNVLCALSIKGSTPAEFRKNTGVAFDEKLFWGNFSKLVASHFPFYLTYTNMDVSSIARFESEVKERYPSDYEWILQDSFPIALVHYLALDD